MHYKIHHSTIEIETAESDCEERIVSFVKARNGDTTLMGASFSVHLKTNLFILWQNKVTL